MPDPKGNVNKHVIEVLLRRRGDLRRERAMLKKAPDRITEIEGELAAVGEELTTRGHTDPEPEA
jgi:hypothetical protein